MKIRVNEDLKRSLNIRWWRKTRKALIVCRQQVVDKAEHIDADRLRGYVPDLLLIKPIQDHLIDLWGQVGGKFAYDTDKLIQQGKKAVKKDKAEWERLMRAYAAERSLTKAKAILTTEQEAINLVIDKVIKRSIEEGLSILDSRKLLKESLEGEELAIIENWQAERIARTEVNSAGNMGSFDAASENAEGVTKEWLTSGLPNTRQSHLDHEALGPVEMDYDYATGLQFPGDPDCEEAEEVINCRCTYVMDII